MKYQYISIREGDVVATSWEPVTEAEAEFIPWYFLCDKDGVPEPEPEPRWKVVETPDTEPTFTVRMAHAGGARIWRDEGAEVAILAIPGDPAIELPWIGVLDWLDSRVVDPHYRRV